MNKNARLQCKAAEAGSADILDLSPDDLSGEQWADVPALDGLVRISSKGRLKRMQREVVNHQRGITYTIGDKILKLKFHKFFNKHLGEYTQHPIGVVRIENKTRYLTISRIVYHCFVEPFDLKDHSVLVVPKDHNGLNMDPANLIKVSYAGFQQHIVENERRDPQFWKKNSHGKPFYEIGQQSHNIEISQYSLEGKLLATFPSTASAARSLNISESSITRVITKQGMTSHGFIWRRGKASSIRVTKAIKNLVKENGPVSQYSLQGVRLHTFDNVAAAAASIGSSSRNIREACKGMRRVSAGYIWRYGAAK